MGNFIDTEPDDKPEEGDCPCLSFCCYTAVKNRNPKSSIDREGSIIWCSCITDCILCCLRCCSGKSKHVMSCGPCDLCCGKDGCCCVDEEDPGDKNESSSDEIADLLGVKNLKRRQNIIHSYPKYFDNDYENNIVYE